jgi:predicted RNase H-like HicB family nuclease
MKKNLPERYAYPACFTLYHDDGDYWIVRFPDLENCMTNAETLEETIEQAHNILEDYMALLERDGHVIPKPTPYKNLKAGKNEIVQIVVVPMAHARRRWDESAVKKTLTLPRWLDEMGQQADVNFSQILQEGLRKRLNIQAP